MFVRLRIMAHDALRNYMNSDPELYADTAHLISKVIKKAETDVVFANELDFECCKAFNEQTADEYYDLVNLFDCLDDAPDELRDLLTRYDIIHKED